MCNWLSYEFQVKHFKYEDCPPERFYTSQVSKYQAVSKFSHRAERVEEFLVNSFSEFAVFLLIYESFLRKIETLCGFLSCRKQAVENADNGYFSLCMNSL